MILPEQCRAARALLGWSQDDLEREAGVAKKTIADFEREARSPRVETRHSLQTALEAKGIVFIPQNGGGAGVRLRTPLPRLVRRAYVPEKEWVAFAFDYKGRRDVAFIRRQAFADSAGQPEKSFDALCPQILLVAAEKIGSSEGYPTTNTVLERGDILHLTQARDE